MLKTDVKGGVASRIGANRFFCSRGFFLSSWVTSSASQDQRKALECLITCGPDPPLQYGALPWEVLIT